MIALIVKIKRMSKSASFWSLALIDLSSDNHAACFLYHYLIASQFFSLQAQTYCGRVPTNNLMIAPLPMTSSTATAPATCAIETKPNKCGSVSSRNEKPKSSTCGRQRPQTTKTSRNRPAWASYNDQCCHRNRKRNSSRQQITISNHNTINRRRRH